MRILSDFNEIKSAIGTEIGVSDWIEVSQERINQFAEATCDEQWIHVDQPATRSSWLRHPSSTASGASIRTRR